MSSDDNDEVYDGGDGDSNNDDANDVDNDDCSRGVCRMRMRTYAPPGSAW